MPRQSNGTYQQPAATAAVSGATISSSAFNTLTTDIGTELTNSVDRAGRSAMTADLPMGSKKITGMADPVASTDGATKNYVDTVQALMFSTGDVKFTLKTVADSGWIMANDGTIGNSTSGANLASSTAQALFTLIWGNISNTWAPIYDSSGTPTSRGANAAADFAASKRLAITRALGRALGISGAGSGLTSRALGEYQGEETHVLTQGELPNVTFNVTIPAGQGAHHHNLLIDGGAGGANPIAIASGRLASSNSSLEVDQTLPQMTGTAPSGGSGTAHNNIQPTTFLNAMIKL